MQTQPGMCPEFWGTFLDPNVCRHSLAAPAAPRELGVNDLGSVLHSARFGAHFGDAAVCRQNLAAAAPRELEGDDLGLVLHPVSFGAHFWDAAVCRHNLAAPATAPRELEGDEEPLPSHIHPLSKHKAPAASLRGELIGKTIPTP